VLYETAGYATIRFLPLTLEWLTDRQDCLGGGAHAESYGSGCAGTGGTVPTLVLGGGCPTPAGCFTIDLRGARAGAPAVLNLGFSRAAVAVPPCTLLVGLPVAALPLPVDGGGTASLRLTVPAAAGAFDLTAQSLALDSGAALGVAASDGLELRIF
jgi:hypothetical protein